MKKIFLFLLFGLSAYSYNYFGSIAINKKTGHYGYSYDYETQEMAEKAALEECGKNCEVAVWFQNSCGTVAYSAKAKDYAWAWGGILREIEDIALKDCAYGDCYIITSVCTTQEFYY